MKKILICTLYGLSIFLFIFSINFFIDVKKFNISANSNSLKIDLLDNSDISLLDNELKSIEGYLGYRYDDITVKTDKGYFYMLNENYNEFYSLNNVVGDKLNYSNELFEVIVGGNKFKSSKIGDKFNVSLDKLDGTSLNVEAVIVGKLDNYCYPEYKTMNELALINEGFFIGKDTYMSDLIDTSNSDILLNMDITNMKKSLPIINKYGSITILDEYTNNEFINLKENTLFFIIFIIEAFMLVLILNYFNHISLKTLKDNFYNLISFIVALISILIYNLHHSFLNFFKINYLNILLILGILLINIFINISNNIKINRIKGGNYEKL